MDVETYMRVPEGTLDTRVESPNPLSGAKGSKVTSAFRQHVGQALRRGEQEGYMMDKLASTDVEKERSALLKTLETLRGNRQVYKQHVHEKDGLKRIDNNIAEIMGKLDLLEVFDEYKQMDTM